MPSVCLFWGLILIPIFPRVFVAGEVRFEPLFCEGLSLVADFVTRFSGSGSVDGFGRVDLFAAVCDVGNTNLCLFEALVIELVTVSAGC